MKKGIKYKTASLLARLHARRVAAEEPVAISYEISNATALLVLMPREAHQFEQANYVLSQLHEQAASLRIHTFVNEIYKTWLDRGLIKDAVIYHEKDFSRMTGLPRNELINHVAQLECGIALDLNLEYNLPAAYLAAVSQSRVRIALEREENTFFNVLIQIQAEDPRELYQKYANQVMRSCFKKLQVVAE
ncbi:MAG: hypothetical protein ISR91_05840 [Candidatus Delongbacteria bacterium]|nr:hypothetical protein [bacterium]MBL7033651.1 hypothetical protein [Candidatus Delongbacteria bacterium]